jgi:putative transposase
MQAIKTHSFTTEIPLHTSSFEQSVLSKRFWAAKQQYNALLGEVLKRLDSMRNSKKYQEVRKLYQRKSTKTQAKALFKELATTYHYREYDLYAYCKQWNTKGNPLSIGARISQQLAKRAFQAVKEYELGKRGKPRFKGYRGIKSIEDNSIDANLKLKDNTISYLGLQIPLLPNTQDPVHQHGLNSKVKYLRLVGRTLGQRKRYFAQLICEGTPLIKNPSPNHIVGLDIGPQTVAIVSPQQHHAQLKIFADQLKPHTKQKKKLQQKLSRQLRANNPSSFQQDQWHKKDKNYKRKKGSSIKGTPLKKRSQALQKTTAKLADLHRKEAAFRKTQHGKLVNDILRIGNHIKTEKLHYTTFQKLYGSSVGLRAPGLFLQTLQRKAENAGGKVEEFNTWSTALSQTCHCGKREKKPLKERWHKCSCGVQAQRDLYSAYLASFVINNTLIADQAQKAWSGMDIALRTAVSRLKQTSSRAWPSSLGIKPGSESVVCTVS